MNIGHSSRNVLPKLELTSALGDFDSPQFAGPIVDILEQMSVNGTEVTQVECARGNASPAPLEHITTFNLIQDDWINNPKAVSKNSGARIDVGIVVLCHFAAARACASM
jgi:hypothetical protein